MVDTIEFRRTEKDLLAFSEFLSERMGQFRRQKIWGVVFAVLFLGGAALWQFQRTAVPAVALAYLGAGAVYAVVWVRWLGPWQLRRCLRRAVRRLYGVAPVTSHELTLTEAGIEESSSEGNTFYSWSGIPEITRTNTHLFLFVGPAAAHIVPVAAFRSERDADAFFLKAQQRKATAH